MGPDQTPAKLGRLIKQNQAAEVLHYLVERSWPLERDWRGPRDKSAISFELRSAAGDLALSFLIVTASNSRTGDILISLTDLKSEEGNYHDVPARHTNGDIFSRTFCFNQSSAGNSEPARYQAVFNALCLIAETHVRDGQLERDRAPQDLEVGVAEKTIKQVINSKIDFASLVGKTPRLFCDDSQRLSNGAESAWIDFSLSADGSQIGLTFSQNIHGTDYNPFMPRICIREPAMGGSRYRSGRVHSALKVLFAVDGLFPPPPGLILPPLS